MRTDALRRHWFFAVSPWIVGVDVVVALHARGQFDRVLEAGLLFDLAILVPCLYWLCYRGRGRTAATRATALACLGIWAALKLVPADERDLFVYVEPLRYIGLAALILLEIVVAARIYRSVFSGKSVAEAAAEAPRDLPPWAVRLMAWEASLWRKVWRVLVRLVERLVKRP